MSRSAVLVSGVVTLLAVASAPLLFCPRSAPAAPPAAASFSGKPLFVMAKNDVSTTLEKPEVRELGGRAFLVGREKDSAYAQARFPGSTVWVPVDSITQLVELEGPGQGKE